jgi:hypothetical protein
MASQAIVAPRNTIAARASTAQRFVPSSVHAPGRCRPARKARRTPLAYSICVGVTVVARTIPATTRRYSATSTTPLSPGKFHITPRIITASVAMKATACGFE